jgi:hypothetical protein
MLVSEYLKNLIRKQMENKEQVKKVLESFRCHWIKEYQERVTDEQLAGIMLAQYFSWNGLSILKVCFEALEDSNFHTENKTIQLLINKLKN